MTSKTEIFLETKYPGYLISNLGRVKSKTKILKTRINGGGYERTNLSSHRAVLVHRLVAEAFIPNPNNLPFVNHKDGNKLNNRADNLEWCTTSQNHKHAYRTGLRKNKTGQDNVLSNYSNDLIALIKSQDFSVRGTMAAFSKKHGLRANYVWQVYNNVYRKYG